MFGRTTWQAEAAWAGVFVAYVVLVGTVAWHHEPWFDEAQAWLIARDSGLTEMLWERLRYEGTPGLWHLMLFVPAKLGFPYATLTFVSVLLAAATVYLFLRYSPFPWYIKLAFPFGFFTVYQYAVVARSYTLMALLLTALAALFRRRNDHPVLFFTLLALLANANAHGFIIAGFLAAYHLWHLWLGRSGIAAKCFRRHVLGALVLALIAAVVVVLVWPPEDLGFPAGEVRLDNTRLVFDAFTPYQLLSALVLAASAVWFAKQRTLLLWGGPTLVLLWLFVFHWANQWHQGAIYYYWVFCVWVSWDEGRSARAAPEAAWHAGAFRYVKTALAVVLAFHVYWGAVCSVQDVRYAYSGSREAYAYFVQRSLGRREIHAQGFSTVSLLPYFAKNIFDNYHRKQNPSYLLWAKGSPLLQTRSAVCAEAPEYLLVGIKYDDDPGLHHPGYRLVRQFEGRMFWKDRVLEPDSLYLYRREPQRVAAN